MTALSGAVALIVAVPFAAAVAGLAIGKRRRLARLIAVLGTGLPLALALVAGTTVWGGEREVTIWGEIPTGWVPIEISTRADGLSLTLAVMVAAVTFAVQVYSTSYMGRDPRYGSYAALVSLFTAAMLLVVVADDLIILLVGWEIMGICSSLLIGHYWELPEARAAAVKAFIVTHLGDAGLLVGFFLLADLAGSFRVSVIATSVEPSATLTVALILVLCGVVGKSAQVPLHVWLPDAMAGPTPISALIHAATMVAAGVFLVARLYDAFLLSATAMAVLAVVASVTMVFAALCALAQDDLKKVLAWSTSSQLAYMLGGLAVGGYSAGLFHLVSHAAFKALLFLAAGAIAHAIGSTLLSRMGGLSDALPRTYFAMTIGLAALVGVPPLAGFFSKESILSAAEDAAVHGGPLPGWAAWLVLLAGLATVLLTGAYATRAWLLAFHGEPAAATPDPPAEVAPATASTTPSPPAAPHDPPATMYGPMVGLAIPAVFLGVLASALPTAFDRGVDVAGVSLHLSTGVISLLLIAVGVYAAYSRWRGLAGRDPALALGPAQPLLAGGFGVDQLYDTVLVRPTYAMSRLVLAGDRDVIHPYVLGAGRAFRALGALPRAAQSGRVQSYVTAVLAFVVVLALAGVAVGLS
jgi:NADH-quinone oxidoreductase subunit L